MSSLSVPVVQFLSSNGDGTGTTNFAGDYSSTQGRGYITPSKGEIINIKRISLHLSDNGIFARDGFAAGSAITNGLTISAVINGVTYPYTGVIKTNDDLPHWFTSFNLTLWNSVANTLTGHIDFSLFDENNTDTQPHLKLQNGESINLYLNDNLTGLVEVLAIVHGFKVIDV